MIFLPSHACVVGTFHGLVGYLRKWKYAFCSNPPRAPLFCACTSYLPYRYRRELGPSSLVSERQKAKCPSSEKKRKKSRDEKRDEKRVLCALAPPLGLSFLATASPGLRTVRYLGPAAHHALRHATACCVENERPVLIDATLCTVHTILSNLNPLTHQPAVQ